MRGYLCLRGSQIIRLSLLLDTSTFVLIPDIDRLDFTLKQGLANKQGKNDVMIRVQTLKLKASLA